MTNELLIALLSELLVLSYIPYISFEVFYRNFMAQLIYATKQQIIIIIIMILFIMIKT